MPTLAWIIEAAGAFALWASLYVAAVFICIWQIAGAGRPPAAAIGAAASIAAATYLLDRAKLSDRRLDPADPAAHPIRASIIRPRRRFVRALIVVLGLIGGACAWTLHPAAAALAPAALLGVALYAGRPPAPGQPRVKDRLILKNVAVGVSHAALASGLAVAAWWDAGGVVAAGEAVAAGGAGRDWLVRLVIGAAFACLIVTADAILCDLDDVAADARFGTRTLPGALSRGAAIRWALGVEALAGAGLLVAMVAMSEGVGSEVASGAGAAIVVWAVGAPLSAAAIIVARRGGPVRDLIDARLPAMAVAVAAFG